MLVVCLVKTESEPLGGRESKGLLSRSIWELERRKKLDMVRLKLDVEPRVGRRVRV